MLRNTMKKRGELAFSQIVIAVVAIFVLIVLMVIFGGNLGGVNKDLGTCIAKGGTCMSEDSCKTKGGLVRPGSDLCKEDPKGDFCCITTVTLKKEEPKTSTT